MNSSPRVLVIDGASDTETVLRAVLEPQGTSVGRRRNRSFATNIETQAPPEVVVIDIDAEPEALSGEGNWSQRPRVLLGSHRPNDSGRDERFLEKPFQYPELVRIVQELLDERTVA